MRSNTRGSHKVTAARLGVFLLAGVVIGNSSFAIAQERLEAGNHAQVRRVVLLSRNPTRGQDGFLYHQIGIEFEGGLGFIAMGQTATAFWMVLVNGERFRMGSFDAEGRFTPSLDNAFDWDSGLLRGWAHLPEKGNMEVYAGIIHHVARGGAPDTLTAFRRSGAEPFVVPANEIPLLGPGETSPPHPERTGTGAANSSEATPTSQSHQRASPTLSASSSTAPQSFVSPSRAEGLSVPTAQNWAPRYGWVLTATAGLAGLLLGFVAAALIFRRRRA